MVKSAYIHIPFCKQKCKYCSFVSYAYLAGKNDYLRALCKEISSEYKGEELDTLYFGGGTPSLLKTSEILKLLEMFNLSKNTEITLEVNPETVDAEYFNKLRETKVNRLSIGAQSFDDWILKEIGRRHRSIDIKRAVRDARSAGFDNISLDFIYGLPNQSVENFIISLKHAINLDVEHISLYGLKIEPECYYAEHPPKNIANDETQAIMYEKAIETLIEAGYEQYEISNFAKPEKYSRHNCVYWKNQEYYGFGISAHGYVDKTRYANEKRYGAYCENPLKKEFSEIVTKEAQLEEEIFLGLRLKKGINLSNVNEKYNIDFEKKYKSILEKYLQTGHLCIDNGNLYFSTQGFLVSNEILSEFLEL